MASSSTSKFQPALLGGLVMGVLSALPIVNAGNLCCCLWVIVGGGIAAYLLQANQPEPIATGDGAVVGLLAGVIGAVVSSVISIPLNLMMGPVQARMMQRALENVPDIPPAFLTFAESSGVTILGAILQFVVMLVAGAIFSTVGGIIGAAMFRTKTPPATNEPPLT